MPEVKKVFLFLCIASAALLLYSPRCDAQSCAGSANTLLYLWRSESEEGDTSQTHILVSEQFHLNCRNLLTDGLSFHAFLRALKDFAPDDSADFQRTVKVHNLYAQYSPGSWMTARMGRQFISYGVARGSMDGAASSFKIPGIARLAAFAGLGVSSESLTVNSWSESGLIGGQILINYVPRTNLSASILSRTDHDTTVEQNLGLDARFTPYPGLRQSLGAVYDLLNSELTKVGIGCFSTGSTALSAFLSYTYTKPTFSENSFFDDLEAPGFSRVKLGMSYYPDWILTPSLIYVTSLYRNGNSHHVEISAQSDWVSVGLGHSFGFGGGRTGGFVNAVYQLKPGFDLALGLDYARYRIASQENDSDREDDLAAYLGGDLALLKNTNIHTRIEYLLNDEFSYDIRFLSALSIGFGRPGA